MAQHLLIVQKCERPPYDPDLQPFDFFSVVFFQRPNLLEKPQHSTRILYLYYIMNIDNFLYIIGELS